MIKDKIDELSKGLDVLVSKELTNYGEPGDFCSEDGFYKLMELVRADLYKKEQNRLADVL